MNFKANLCKSLVAVSIGLGAGCASKTESGPMAGQALSIKDMEKFTPLGKVTAAAVQCIGLHEHVRPDGRLEVVANIKNHSAKNLSLQVNCVFRDIQGFSVGDGTAFC